MKRLHSDCARRFGKRKPITKGLTEEKQESKVICREWELEEDLYLKSLGCKPRLINWRQKHLEMNQTLGISNHNAEECRMRHRFLFYAEEENKWLPNEGLILLCCAHYAHENYLKKEVQLLGKHPEEIRKYLKHGLWLTAYQASQGSLLEEKTLSSTNILQISFYIKLLADAINKQRKPLPEALRVAKEFKLTEEQCLNYLYQIKLFPKEKLNFGNLEDFTNSAFESICNSLHLFDSYVELEEIFHSPKNPVNEVQPEVAIQSYYDAERYLLFPLICNQIPSGMIFYGSFPVQYYP